MEVDACQIAFAPSNSQGSCVGGVLAQNAVSLGLDFLGTLPIPEAGGVTRLVGQQLGVGKIGAIYRGVVADQQGAKVLNGLRNAASGTALLGNGSDTSGLGLASTAVGGAALTAGYFVPVLGQVLSGGQLLIDSIHTYKAIQGEMLRSQLKANFENDLRTAQRLRLPWWAVWCVVLPALPFFIYLDHRGRLDLALPILASIATIALVILLKRRCANQAWFWGVIVLFSALHFALIWFVPWPTRWVFPLLSAAIASADFCVLLFAVSFVELLMGKQSNEE